jgi:hypothetical protein
VLGIHVLDELVLAVVPNITLVTLIGPSVIQEVRNDLTCSVYLLVVGVAALVVVFVANGGEGASAVLAFVRLFPSVDPHVHEQVSPLVEVFLTPHALEEAVARAH